MELKGKQVSPWIADLVLLSVAAVWGGTFVAVKNAVEEIPPYAFIGIRFFLATLFLMAVFPKSLGRIDQTTLRNGGLLGIFMFAGYAFQTIGLMHTTSSNAGFITGLSVVLVPLFGMLFLRQIPHWRVAIAIFVATIGLGMMTLSENLTVGYGDILVFFCAIGFGLHIFFTGQVAQKHDAVALTIVQLGVVTVFAWGAWFFFEPALGKAHFTADVGLALFLTAVPATSLAFLAQMYLQKFTTATRTALIFASEPVFALIFAMWLAGEVLMSRGYLGGALVLAAIVLAELAPAGSSSSSSTSSSTSTSTSTSTSSSSSRKTDESIEPKKSSQPSKSCQHFPTQTAVKE